MHLDHLRWLGGPNLYVSRPVAIARLELEELTGRETTDFPGFADRLVPLLPGLTQHHCSAGRPGGLLEAMARGTYFGHVTEHVTLELSSMIGREVFFGRTVWAGAPGRYDVILECPRDEPPEDPIVERLLRLAMRTVTELLAGGAPVLGPEVTALASAYGQTRLGVSTAALAEAARRRGIPVRRMGHLNLLQLGHGRYRRMVWAAMTDRTSAVGMETAADKMLTKRLLEEAGLPVPSGCIVTSAEEAVAVLAEIGGPVVVKPLSGHHGEMVSIELSDPAEVSAAFRAAATVCEEVLVESYVPGRDHRVLVVGEQVVAAAELSPARVTGDGRSTIAGLVARANADPARGEGHDRPLTRLALGDTELAHLAGRGLSPGHVPADGETVTLRRNANLSTGGTSKDVTDRMHPDVIRLCRRVAATVGLDVCGIDLRLPDIGAPLPPEASGVGVIEVNSSPGLRMHLAPYEGRSRDVAADIIDQMYPPGATARVPLVAVTGTNGKTTTVRMVAHLLGQDGRQVGMSTTEGVYVGNELIYKADASGPRSAQMVLGNRTVEAAVLETARGGIVRRGLGYDRADVAVITNITDDHLGVDDIDTVEDLVEIKALVAEEIRPGGHIVLNADDPRVAGFADRPAVRRRKPVVRYFAQSGTNEVVSRHLRAEGVAYFVEDGWLVEAESGRTRALLPIGDVAGSFGGKADYMVANALAAAAAARALGVSMSLVARGLQTFDPHRCNPGRSCSFRVEETPIIVDYAHNPAAVAAVGGLLRRVWGRDGVATVTLPGDRCDDLVMETAREVARAFDRVVVYEDEDLRGRRAGEMTRLIIDGLTQERPDVRIRTAGDLKDAVGIALGLTTPGEPLLLLYEKLQPVADLLQTLGAAPTPTSETPR
ncbi:cyanophycin synthetase [Actinoallomurus iriomotensis]|uniref:Cyanophycin synthetase n=1 Tax=Actinoallomurus iriomotensis TaxID=478107 RepID=A0A9W6S6N3_9ACTN|nr:cyanophycin synthetase [Actinoallomurus iriomotensis]GLY88156.1 cyanophycin synthetase [Actinoallomurus iriomotensis]